MLGLALPGNRVLRNGLALRVIVVGGEKVVVEGDLDPLVLGEAHARVDPRLVDVLDVVVVDGLDHRLLVLAGRLLLKGRETVQVQILVRELHLGLLVSGELGLVVLENGRVAADDHVALRSLLQLELLPHVPLSVYFQVLILNAVLVDVLRTLTQVSLLLEALVGQLVRQDLFHFV